MQPWAEALPKRLFSGSVHAGYVSCMYMYTYMHASVYMYIYMYKYR